MADTHGDARESGEPREPQSAATPDADAGGGPAAGPAADDQVRVCRSARLTRPAYRFYRDLLLSFPRYGRAPTMIELAALAAQYDAALHATLTQFAVQDLVQRNPTTGAIRAAYPFSGTPTAHRVHLEATREEPAVELYAMCAIDALGIPLMLRRAATITSADGLTGEPVQVTVVPVVPVAPVVPLTAAAVSGTTGATGTTGTLETLGGADWRVAWQPPAAVVYARLENHEHEHDCGSEAAGACCPVTNFFTSEAHAQEWAATHAHRDGRVFSQGEALSYAARLFGGVLDRLPTYGDARETPVTPGPGTGGVRPPGGGEE